MTKIFTQESIIVVSPTLTVIVEKETPITTGKWYYNKTFAKCQQWLAEGVCPFNDTVIIATIGNKIEGIPTIVIYAVDEVALVLLKKSQSLFRDTRKNGTTGLLAKDHLEMENSIATFLQSLHRTKQIKEIVLEIEEGWAAHKNLTSNLKLTDTVNNIITPVTITYKQK